MKLALDWGRVAEACRGRLSGGDGEAPFDALETDSRRELKGRAFWALKGPNHDAHDFLADTLTRGAAGWVVEIGRAPKTPRAPNVLEVEDTLKALQALAAYHRKRFKTKIAGITGSNGKTTTKEMLSAICAQTGKTCATRGNLNNHVGVPLSLFELTEDHAYGVFEMGASRRGEIAELTAIATPDAGVLTNIAPAHLEFFGSLETIFETKSELARGISGPVAVNASDPWLKRLLPELGSRAVTYGTEPGSRVRILENELNENPVLPLPPEGGEGRVRGGYPFVVEIDGRRIDLALSTPGRLNRLNAAAAAAGALALGLPIEAIQSGLASFNPPPMRMERRAHASGTTFIVDAYNANPGSMRSALDGFIESFPRERRYAVLGDMRELGKDSPTLHRELAERVKTLPLEGVVLVGPEMAPAAEVLKGSKQLVAYGPDADSVAAAVRSLLGPGRAVFFKASRAIGLERLVEKL